MKLYQKLIWSLIIICVIVAFSSLAFMIVNQKSEIKTLQEQLKTSKSQNKNLTGELSKKTTSTETKAINTLETSAKKDSAKTIGQPKPDKPLTQKGTLIPVNDFTISGEITVTQESGEYQIELSDDFNSSGPIGSFLYLCQELEPTTIDDCLSIGKLTSDTGPQKYTTPTTSDIKYTHAIIWVKANSVLVGSAILK